ncbi:TraB/GumN family protein [Candidatus Clostridium stratigraminis]|uniref:TraB/GumN family protein n=1 Tax=Candidatus Clostridium stratigraminis TaxID=3381661 RepID=A0ABW8T995_9CLOT
MRKITKKTGIFLIILSMFLSVSAGGCKQEKKYGDVKGMFWEVKKGNSTVYILGTDHVGEKKFFPMAQVVEDAFDSSNIVVGEIDSTDTAEMSSAKTLMEYSNSETAMDHLSPAGKEKMNKLCKELNLNPETLLNEKIYAIGLTIQLMQSMSTGFDPAYGIDNHYLFKAKDNGKKIEEMESVKFQFDILNSFSDKEQENEFLLNVGTIEETKKLNDDIFKAYKAGDEEKLKELAFGDKNSAIGDKNSNIYKKWVLERNIGMANKIEEYLKTNNTYFVMAGTFHFVGDDSVIKMLRDKGYTVEKK